jgi:carbon-monoxide dehydrogenase large subunit
MIGTSVARKEDPRLLTGRGTFVDDLTFPGTVHMGFVRSDRPHARILSVDSEGARARTGVLGVWSAADMAGMPGLPTVPGMLRPCLATGEVRFVGEPVAVVVATDGYLAADAAADVVVEYDTLTSVGSVEDAVAPGAPVVLDGLPSNVVVEQALSSDDAEGELAASAHRLQLHLVNQRCAAVPLEPTAALADWNAGGLTLYATVQTPHGLRNAVAALFGLAQHEVRVVAPDVGGGFGARAGLYPEYLLVCELSRRLGRPVKYTETRSENLVSMTHGRAQVHDLDVGFDDEGHITALRALITQDVGGWPDPLGLALPSFTSMMLGGCYRIPKIAPTFRCVTTNTTPVSAYRGAGRPEASFAIERVMDTVADELGLDALEVRRRNFIQPEQMPYSTQFEGIVYDEADYPRVLDLLLLRVGYEKLRGEQVARREDPTAKLLGIGFSTFVELGGFGPSPLAEQMGMIGGWESAKVRLNPDATAVVTVGTSPHGQGHETAFAQIVSDVLAIPMDQISVLHGDTATVQEGIGTVGSRGIAVGGNAVLKAAGKVRDKALRIAAHLLEADPADVEFIDGRFQVRGSQAAGLDLPQIALASLKPHRLPPDIEMGLDETAHHEPANLTYPSGAHCCVVEVDRDTGKVEVVRYVAVDDCGTVINPLLARGQVEGGVAQGIAQALYEQVTYAEDGQPLAATLVGYTLPSALELPAYETSHHQTPTRFNPLGAKGLGESGATAAPQAVVNAVVDALRHLGVRNIDMPCTPEKVWRAINAAERPADGSVR